MKYFYLSDFHPQTPQGGLLSFQKSKVPPPGGRDLGRGKSGKGAKNLRGKDLYQ